MRVNITNKTTIAFKTILSFPASYFRTQQLLTVIIKNTTPTITITTQQYFNTNISTVFQGEVFL